MKKENPVSHRLRITSVSIIEELYCTGEYDTYKDAARYFFNTARRKHQKTGFKLKDFDKFYGNYRKFKSRNKKDLME